MLHTIKWEKNHQFRNNSTQLLHVLRTFQVYNRSIHFCKGYITGVLNMQTILMLYRVCTNYTGCNMIFFLSLSLIHTLVILNSHISNKNWNCWFNVHMVKNTGWSKLCIFHQTREKRSLIWLLINTAYILSAWK